MQRLIRPFVVPAAMLFLCVSCGDDKTTTPSVDTTAPSAITDLTVSDSMGTSMHVHWTATGDDGVNGTANAYEIRLSTEPLNAANWDAAMEVDGAPAPAASGTSQTIVIDDLTWWTRYYVGVRVRDDADNWSAISNIAAGSPYPDPDWRFLIGTNSGIVSVDMSWNTSAFTPAGEWIEILDDHVYCGAGSIVKSDFDGNVVTTTPLANEINNYGFAALPDDRYVLMSHLGDSLIFINDAGDRLASRGLPPEPEHNRQMLAGVVVGNDLIMSEDGFCHLLRIDLDTYEISQFKDLTVIAQWLGAIDYADGLYCICQSRNIWHFSETGDPQRIARMEQGSISGAVMAGGYTFVVVNLTGAFYRVHNVTGEIVRLVEGLDYPKDLELMMR